MSITVAAVDNIMGTVACAEAQFRSDPKRSLELLEIARKMWVTVRQQEVDEFNLDDELPEEL